MISKAPHPHDETQRIPGVPGLHSRPLRITATFLLVAALGMANLAWQRERGNAFEPAFEPRPGPLWPALQGIRPGSGAVLRGQKSERMLAWVDLEGSVHAETIWGQAFPPLLGVNGTPGALLAFDLNSDLNDDLVVATLDRQLLAFDGKQGIRLAATDWFAEPILGAPVLCRAEAGNDWIAVHSAAGKIARYDARTLRVRGQEIYHRSRTRGPSSAYDVNGDGTEDLIMGDEAGQLVWLDPISGELNVIVPAPFPAAAFPQSPDALPPIRSGVCGFDYTGDGLNEWVFRTQSGAVLMCDHDGDHLAGWQGPFTDTSAQARYPAPLLADLDLQGPPEIIVAHPAGSVYAFQAPRTVPGPLSVLWKASSDDTINDEIALADLTGDEVKDVVVVTRTGMLAILSGRDGRRLHSWLIGANGSPLIEDLNGDGLLEIVVPTDSAWAVMETGSKASAGNSWPTWRGDPGRKGRCDPQRGRPSAVFWGAAGLFMVVAAALWIKS